MFLLYIENKLIALILIWVSLPHMGKALFRSYSIQDIV